MLSRARARARDRPPFGIYALRRGAPSLRRLMLFRFQSRVSSYSNCLSLNFLPPLPQLRAVAKFFLRIKFDNALGCRRGFLGRYCDIEGRIIDDTTGCLRNFMMGHGDLRLERHLCQVPDFLMIFAVLFNKNLNKSVLPVSGDALGHYCYVT